MRRFSFCSFDFLFLWRLSVGKRKSQKETIDKLVQQINEAKQTNSELEYTISVLKKNREKADEKLKSFIMAMLLLTLLTACTSTKIEYIEKPYLPELNFPFFPELYGDVRNPDDTVTVSGAWVIRLREFQIHYEELEDNYNDFKKKYKGESDK